MVDEPGLDAAAQQFANGFTAIFAVVECGFG